MGCRCKEKKKAELPGKPLRDLGYYTDGVAECVITLFPNNFKGICVDIGAYDPMWLSNSWIFEQAGWEVHCIEPNPKCMPRLRKFRKYVHEYACDERNEDNVDLFVYCVDKLGLGEAAITGLLHHSGGGHEQWFSHVSKVAVRTLDWLMENEIRRDHIDYLSIDVERNEMAVLRGTDLKRWCPKVIAIENLDADAEQTKWLTDRGYRHIHRILVNDIFMEQEYYGASR